MNERIKQMARQSGATDENGSTATTVFCFTERELKSFAELIVKECANKVAGMVMRDKFDTIPRDPHSQGWNDAVAYSSEQVKKHFGVEE